MKRSKDHRALLQRCVWLAQRVAERPFNEDRPRRANSFGEVARQGNAHRRNPCLLECTCDQSHGPITKPSGRGQEGEIDALGAQLCRYLWSAVLH